MIFRVSKSSLEKSPNRKQQIAQLRSELWRCTLCHFQSKPNTCGPGVTAWSEAMIWGTEGFSIWWEISRNILDIFQGVHMSYLSIIIYILPLHRWSRNLKWGQGPPDWPNLSNLRSSKLQLLVLKPRGLESCCSLFFVGRGICRDMTGHGSA
jgi:hypothetical protein